MISSLSTATINQYSVHWKNWVSFCCAQKTTPFNNKVNMIIEFLTNMFHNNSSYTSINTARSAISLITGNTLGEHENLKRFMKGIHNLRPSKPKYNDTWDPKIVLEHLQTLHPNDSISLEMLSSKLITLILLCTGHRLQTCYHIKLDNIKFSDQGATIYITDRIKTSGPKKVQPILVLPYFNENPNLCVAGTLKNYIARTKVLRGKENQLFISFKPPHKAVTTQSLSRWVKIIFEKSGINCKYTPYSIRHASTSLAKRQGVPLELIKKVAGWSPISTTFSKFYDRPLDNNDRFAKTVLSSQM
ncbi:hypothetical protein PPYR_01468 [Photinus pyralis]|uniref:Tyr recombinase domain-containing protein n=2 Tax=Photinus pyralis TaxID=7054 RepID=A0A5N4B4N7_PHOPY|nr:uncharacterized protein LOC116160430 [Photinus pyralis]KAB0804498.1 hypothetical protein PPYR_01468 [Photinus pyralis]